MNIEKTMIAGRIKTDFFISDFEAKRARRILAFFVRQKQVPGTFPIFRCLKNSEGEFLMNNKPNINVTPLIDVLLVLLIIFMVITPAKPTNFKARIPGEPKMPDNANSHPNSLVVAINADSTLRLNTETSVGTVREPEKLVKMLAAVFKQRAENRVYAQDKEFRMDLTETERLEKTVFIKAPRGIAYGNVIKVIDAVKIAGADPISLQIDELR